MPRDVPSERRSWVLRRRAVLRRPQLSLLFATLCCPTLAISIVFLCWGYWHMLAYALLEMTALAACLGYYGRHLDDYDRIDISEDGIVIEQRSGHRCSYRHLDLWSTRLLSPRRDGDPVRLNDRQHRTVELGRFLGAEERRHLAYELNQCLRRPGA
ncbi:Uncharacterized membrane protein [Duganella sp. CF517]|uniref:DUF2244 domain-containing protein n=1 Tax=Duganella sp. CF517 TaxID=1881038 RepID=UPI0008C0F7D9|nr:DUF2244 domain-containing protein [Duganella sp. CF517]SEN59926.1 Uncharacterized membrane protein [Duganella sp. CF517]